MGPGRDTGKKSNIMDPPVFEPDQDLLVRRKRVVAWVELATTAARKGPECTYKSITATFAQHLYELGLPQAQKSIVDEAQALGKIDCKQDDQIKSVQQIVDIVAVDPPIDVVTRLIDSFNKVTSCKKKNGEDLNCFLSRYRGLASEHLIRIGATTSSQVGEILAKNLLQNASLPESTLTNAKINLIQLVEARKNQDEDEPYQISAKNTALILDSFKELKDVESTPDTDDENSLEGTADVLMTIFPVLGSVIKKLEEPFKEMERSTTFRQRESVTKSITTTGPRCVLSLDDAVNVLRSLAQTLTKTDKRCQNGSSSSPSDEMQKVFKEQLRIYFTNSNHGNNGNGNKNRNTKNGQIFFPGSNNWKRNAPNNSSGSQSRPFKKRFTERDFNTKQKTNKIIDSDVCKDCGSKLHIRGDPCDNPTYYTIKIAEAKDERSKSNNKNENNNKAERKANSRQASKHVRFQGV